MFRKLTLAALTAAAGIAAPASADTLGVIAPRSYLHSGLTLRGRVLNPAGAPAVGDTVTVATSAGDPLSATTNTAGRYTLTVPRGGSRLLTITAGASTIMVRELVAPSVWLSVRALSGGRLLVIGGLIDGGASPQPPVEVEDATPEGWRVFGVAQPIATGRRSGRFRLVYRSAPSTVGGSFRFRAVTMRAPEWRPGVSRVHTATVL